MSQTTDILIKVAYAEGAKQALLEHGVEDKTAHVQSLAFAEEKFAGIGDVAKRVGKAVSGGARQVGGAAKAVSGGARQVGGAAKTFGGKAKDVASDAKNFPGAVKEYMRINPKGKRNVALAAGAGALSAAGAGLGGKAVHDKLNKE